MELAQVLRMNKGNDGASYAKNSFVQSQIITKGMPTTEKAIVQFLSSRDIPESIGIAELGCSSGPNALKAISNIIRIINTKCNDMDHPEPEFRVFLNDLPTNDFNSIFGLLPEFYKKQKGREFGSCFTSMVGGSFYGRLFPKRSLHFVHSSSSLHWLSQVPHGLEVNAYPALNKGKIYVSESSPSCVVEAYSRQFRKDFSVFLRSRSDEIIRGGRMVLSFMGRTSTDPASHEGCYQWELLANAMMSLVLEGLIEEEKVDSFNVPYYAPCLEEVKIEIEKDGSFEVDRLESFEIDWDGGFEDDYLSRGQRVAKTIRAVVESMLECHFGRDVMDELFRRYGNLVDDYSSKHPIKYVNLVVSVIRKD